MDQLRAPCPKTLRNRHLEVACFEQRNAAPPLAQKEVFLMKEN